MTKIDNFDIKFLKGVGQARASLLNKELSVFSLRDLLFTFPFRYLDRSKIYHISDLEEDMPYVQIAGSFINFRLEGEGRKQRLIGTFSDGHHLMHAVWFSSVKRLQEAYHVGMRYMLFGKPTRFKDVWQMVHPEVEIYNPDIPAKGFVGVYSLTETLRKRNVSSKTIGNLISAAFELPVFKNLDDTLPLEIVKQHRLMPLREALRNIHFPSDLKQLEKAKERLKFEELFYVQLHILRYARRRGVSVKGFVFPRIGEKFNSFYENVLPFPLTDAQKRVLKEIREDMRTGRQMNRLLQGDVGSGKTLVAFMTMLMAIDNGKQACLMAPTEILAEQHFATLSEWCDNIGIKVGLLTGSVRTSARRDIAESLEDGSMDILVGTHALIEDNVRFRNLGIAVIDEQHRFGVAQRARLWSKNDSPPHVLVMTATPIPRTLAMTVYGDLDVSVIDELPPGRKPIQTFLKYEDNRLSVNQLLYKEIKSGRQAYIVYPLIHENEKLSLKSLEQGYQYVRETFQEFKVSMIHGQMTPDEKDFQMKMFAEGESQILVATTVIEVGVNVPNASVMIIENAERFGLSQLHQLRGRVGRGADHSFCFLMSRANIGADTRKRLEIMTQTSNGFIIAEADMQMRGPGNMEGTQQSGIAFNLHIASIVKDSRMLGFAREAARDTLENNPGLYSENDRLSDSFVSSSVDLMKKELAYRFKNTVDWSQIS